MADPLADLRARHELELANASLEAELVELKASGADPIRLAVVKDELRELRRYWRGIRRELEFPDLQPGDVAVAAAPVSSVAEVEAP
jgi:hypothetical protein